MIGTKVENIGNTSQLLVLKYHALAAALAAAAVLLWVSVPFHAAEPLPAQISDEAFWKMVTDLSEPDGSFKWENFVSNELSYQYVLPRLVRTVQPGGAYLGVGPEQNFTYIAALKPKIAFIIDIRRQNMIELLMYKSLFELADTRADFLSMLFARKRPEGLADRSTPEELFTAFARVSSDGDLQKQNTQAIKDLLTKKHGFALRSADLSGNSSIEYVYSVFVQNGPSLDYSIGGAGSGGGNPSFEALMKIDDGFGTKWSFLANEENYRFVRDMERKNIIVPLVGDFAGPKTIRGIGQYLKNHQAVVNTFYVSNVETYLFRESMAGDFYNNVATLPLESSSTFIRTDIRPEGDISIYLNKGFKFIPTFSSIPGLVEEFKAGRVNKEEDLRKLSQ